MTKELKDLRSFKIKMIKINCEKHGLQDSKVFNFVGASQNWTQPHCSLCEEEKRSEEARFEKKKKEEAKRIRIESLLIRSMIPSRFLNYNFENYLVKNEDQKKKKEFCQKYAESFEKMYKNGTSLIFSGNTGTGKTHLACSIANTIITQFNNSAVFMSVIRAVRQIKETYSSTSNRTEQEAIDWFLLPDLLILDEVGVQFGTEAEKIILFEIVNERYQNCKPTILISNLNLQSLSEYIGERVMDRMRDNGGSVLQFTWRSHRGKN